MKNKQHHPPPRVRLYSHVTRTRFLHVEDALNISKVRLFAGAYSRGQGMSGHSSHYLDLPDARILFHALLFSEQGFSYKEYKGTPPPAPRGTAVSRVLSVTVKGDNVYIELRRGPGKLTTTGAIMPSGRAETEINVSFKLHEARRLAAEVLAYIQAWDVYRMMTSRDVVSQAPAYCLSVASGELNEATPASAITTDVKRPDDTSPPSAAMTRPVTRKGPTNDVKLKPDDAATARVAALAEALYGLEEGLCYGDGLTVTADNAVERQAFQRYMAEKGSPPATKAILQAYYRQQMAI